MSISKFNYNGPYLFITNVNNKIELPKITTSIDGKLTSVIAKGEVNFSKKGVYEVVYTVNDIRMGIVVVVMNNEENIFTLQNKLKEVYNMLK